MLIDNIRIGDTITYVVDDPYARPLKLPTGIDLVHFYKVLDKYWQGDVALTTHYTIKGTHGEVHVPIKHVKLYKRGK